MKSSATKPLPQLATWQVLNDTIASCNRCPRLRDHCITIGQIKRAAYRTENYWARPVPNLGPVTARLLILGLAPGAHGANRTGRLFTGDKSGDFLFEAMHATGFANQPISLHANDGLELIDCAITGAAHCAPPDNKPFPDELAACRDYLLQTLDLLPTLRAGTGGILVLGRIAFDAALSLYKHKQWLPSTTPRPAFAHGALFTFPNAPFLLCTYHPSQQNTFTKRLTQPMLQKIFLTARAHLDNAPAAPATGPT